MTAAAQRAITKNPAATSRLLVAGINHANSSNPSGSGNKDHAAIASAAQRAITKNPAATSRLLAAGINHANSTGSNTSGYGNSTTAASNDDHASAPNVGRVAAAAQAFSVPPKSSSPPVAAQKGPDMNKLVPQKVRSVAFDSLLPSFVNAKREYVGGRGVRNSVMSTYHPPDRCSVLCAAQQQRRTHRPRPCIHHPPLQGRKLPAAFHRLQSVEFPIPRHRRLPLQLRMYLMSRSRKRTPPSRKRRKRVREENGQKCYMIIQARCVEDPYCLYLFLKRRRC